MQDVESYDPILNPVLNREVRRTGGRVLITLGDQDIDLSPSFTIFLSTRDPSVSCLTRDATTVLNTLFPLFLPPPLLHDMYMYIQTLLSVSNLTYIQHSYWCHQCSSIFTSSHLLFNLALLLLDGLESSIHYFLRPSPYLNIFLSIRLSSMSPVYYSTFMLLFSFLFLSNCLHFL